MTRKITVFKEILADSYGEALFSISSPIFINHEVKLNANVEKSRAITHSFAIKIQELFLYHSVDITLHDGSGVKTYVINEVQEIELVVWGMLYASRCNNFHGNAASRINSINADKATFEMYTDVFILEYIILAITFDVSI